MEKHLNDLIEISHFYGTNNEFVIAGGGNTSYKNENTLWVKASGEPLARLTIEGLVALDRTRLHKISTATYSDDPFRREEEVKNDLNAAIIDPSKNKRPSVETSLHEMIRYNFVVHLHPTLINGVLCSRNAKNLSAKLFGDTALFVPYTDPGYTLFKKLETEIEAYRSEFGMDPRIILLENHGVFVAENTTAEIKKIYDNIFTKVEKEVPVIRDVETLPYNQVMNEVLPAMRMMLSEDKPKIIRYRHNSLIAKYYPGQKKFNNISHPLIPDTIVYCKARYLFIEHSSSPERILDSLRNQLPRFKNEYGYLPKVVVIKDMGLFVAEDSYAAAESVLDIFEDLIKISHYALQCGGIKVLTPDQVSFIDQWEVENYRRKVAKTSGGNNKMAGKTAVITGAAQGFGAGIAEALFKLSVNIVVADLNTEAGEELVKRLNSERPTARASFFKTDVSDHESVRKLVDHTVSQFGGIDLFVSNAGILRAGSLDEMDPDVFSKTTQVNYNAYFYCTKYASAVMKLQNEARPDYFTDIIQVNSKSGLRGSNRNFAYAGAKFGGIGLTQSFALELAPYRIKVNSICPGNFYEGPLWSDPHNGLFVQYLKTGKVPGAKTIDDVRKYYEDQVPLKRGCRLEDVVKALLYIVDQEYETGQAVPVTGGQVMLG